MLHLLHHHKYLFLFIGLFLSGETVFLIGIYFSLIGALNLYFVIALTFFSSLAAEMVWYYIGTQVSYEKLKTLPFVNTRQHHIDRLERFMDHHSLKAVFYSKFAYGTRTIVQILCGTHKVNFWKYIAVNIVGTIAIIAVLVGVSKTLVVSFSSFRHAAHSLELAFIGVVAIVITFHILIKKYVIERMEK